ncbi:Flp pilus assembly complex ATPase component TadA [Patescibacteria group bacterium]|nr:Flp pilus assembly complex ATPase component TadA [Patescibacteria group bacterium]MBU4482450.1 Flp pilus assembly complex ATPase component TadA [Patescibacteria group bacterium]
MIQDKLKFDDLLTQLVKQGASDLYLTSGKPAMFKIVDEFKPANNEILTNEKIEQYFLPLMNVEQKKVLQIQKSLVFGQTFSNGLRFKINLFYAHNFLAADLHFISPIVKDIKELGLPSKVEEIANISSGLVVLSGPFHSGKTTTATAILEYLNNAKFLKIITLEKPIGIVLTSKKSIIQQREIGFDTPDLKTGLRDCLITNLDAVLVSGFENKLELELILELAEQGKTVFLITSAVSVLDTLAKFLALFGEDERPRIANVLSRTLQAVVCQKLIKNKKNNWLVVPEILVHNQAVQSSIAENKVQQLDNIIRTSAKFGMISFEQSLSALKEQGEI